MGRNQYTCKFCNKDYWSYKPKSDFCSIDCRQQYRAQFTYNCDNCGKLFRVTPSRLKSLEDGKYKKLYCCRECANQGNTTSVTIKCLNCNKDFQVFKSVSEITKYCSRECYDEFRNRHSIAAIKVCPVCGEIFTTYHHNQIHCSKKCSGIAGRNRVSCVCDYCGRDFVKKAHQYHPNGKNYCSNECRLTDQSWHTDELDIVIENFSGKRSCNKISQMLNRRWDSEAVYRKAIILGLTKSRLWTQEEKKIVEQLYPTCPLEEIKKILPHKTESAIRGIAHSMNLKSQYYLSRRYTDEENQYLKDNYQIRTNEELGEFLHCSPSAIGQHLLVLGCVREKCPLNERYRTLTYYLRSKIASIVNQAKSDPDACCAVTGKRNDLVLHHIRGFVLIANEAIQNLNLPSYPSLSDYTESQLIELGDEFVRLHEQYHSYVLINKDIHMHFHKLYGYGYNTQAQWDEYISIFYNQSAS